MSVKKMKKALKALSKIENPSRGIDESIQLIEAEIDALENAPETLLEIDTLLRIGEDTNESFSVRRQAYSDALEKGAKMEFNYEKKDSSVRTVKVVWEDDYRYELPPEDSNFIYMYDEEDDKFKHFIFDKMSEVQFSL